MAQAGEQRDPVYGENDSRPVTRPDLQAQEGIAGDTAGGDTWSSSNAAGSRATGDGPVDDLRGREEAGGDEGQTSESEAGGASSSLSGGGASTSSTSSQRGQQQADGSVAGSSGSAGTAGDTGGKYNPEGDNQGRFTGLRRARGHMQQLTAKALKHKLLVGGVLGSGTLIVVILLILALMVGGYKVVAFAENVAAYQFARTTAQMAENTTNITNEKIGIDEATATAEDAPATSGVRAAWNAFKDKATAAGTKASDMWSKLDRFRPQKTISNFQNDGTMTFNRSTTKLGTSYINSVTIKDPATGEAITSDLETKSFTNSLKNNFIPGYKFVNRDVAFSRDFAPDLIKSLEANSIGPITRARVASAIRQELDIGLVAWLTGRFVGPDDKPLDPAQADAEVERESTAAAQGEQLSFFDNGPPAENSSDVAQGPSDGINQAAEDAETSLDDSLANNSDAAAIVANPNQTPEKVADTLAEDVSSTALGTLQGVIGTIIGTFVKLVDPVYKYAVPLCLIYDGSIQQSGPTIDEQSAQTERSALWVQSAAAQEKDGSNVNATAVGATDWKLGNITATNAGLRAEGQPVNTSSYASTEASPTGQYTYSVANFLPGATGTIVNSLSEPMCEALTNIWVGVGVGAVNITAAIFSGGGTGAAEEGSEAAVDATLDTQLSLFDAGEYGTEAAGSSSMLSRMIAKAQSSAGFAMKGAEKIKSGAASAGKFAYDTGKSVAAIGAVTLLAQQLVTSEMGGTHSTVSVGKPYDNTVDCGTNIYANQINQQEFYGAPMTDADLVTDNTNNENNLAMKQKQQSAFDRYASLNNPNSLLSHVALAANGLLSKSSLTSLPGLGKALLNPLRSLGFALNPLTSQTALASSTITSNNTYCGNVQFGYTTAEKNLMNNNPSYQLIENQEILDASGKESEIASTYGQCFTDSIGTLLSQGYLKRNQNGDVLLDDSLCSPKSLGPNNPTYGDLVFRWRVAQSYNNTLDQLNQMQTVSTSDTTATTAPGATTTSSGLPTGSAQQLAQELLPYIQQGKISCNGQATDCPDIQNTAKDISIKGGQGCEVDALSPALLGMMLKLVQMGHTFVLSAICSDHSDDGGTTAGHSAGKAADFNYIDGVFMGPDDVSWDQTKINAAEGLDRDAASFMPKSTGFGQIQCHPTFSFLSGFDTFQDGCTHQHIQVQ